MGCWGDGPLESDYGDDVLLDWTDSEEKEAYLERVLSDDYYDLFSFRAAAFLSRKHHPENNTLRELSEQGYLAALDTYSGRAVTDDLSKEITILQNELNYVRGTSEEPPNKGILETIIEGEKAKLRGVR